MRITCSATLSASRSKASPGSFTASLDLRIGADASPQCGQLPPQAQTARIKSGCACTAARAMAGG
ncbi:hypothetical protein GCM10007857_46760 [Bradyrhizobium iriomotense]|uniref:Uncharacterized protein n=2 Tax=Bradyrhizobium iriomotense TaxID=441950 RepID=A0ABQ6B3D8_9BRAD|nr:hypothetical protein GCM10007857_46760 [Bradyrhizobium iriomotense]